MKNEEIIWKFLYEKLRNAYGTAGLMGNLFAESSLNPILANGIKKHGLTNEQYTSIVDAGLNDNFATDGIAYGLAQWCYKTRKKGLLEASRKANKSVGDINLQLEYLWEELQSYTTVLSTLYQAKNIRTASDIVLLKYEKPANTSEEAKIKRASYGQKYYDKYANAITSLTRSTAIELKEELERALK